MSTPTPEMQSNPRAAAKAAKAYAKASRPWFKKKRYIALISFAVLVVIAMASGGGSTKDDDKPASAAESSATAPKAAEKEPEATKPAEPEMTSGQKNALRAAENYLSFTAFSKAGLIQQLSSSAGDKYPLADARFAANHVDVDWNEQAYKAAKNYLEMTPMSHDGLIRQLESAAGDKYTHDQAVYGAEKALR